LFDTIADSLELFVPGSGQLLRGRWSDGLSVLTGTGFLFALAWAIWETLDRLSVTLTALGYSAQGGVYALALIYACLAGLHAGNVLYGTTRGSVRAHPVIAGLTSVLIPGWGQLLNRQPAKAAAFIAGLWIVGIAWLLASPWTVAWFDAQGLAFRPGFEVFSSPAVLWTAPIVLWVLSIYDAVATARR
jgi:TM2 domain-containing membrane protein YozV